MAAGDAAVKIAVIGTGIAGNVAARRLAREHDITVYEADSRIGGHTNTVDVAIAGRHWAVDTGFIVFNDVTYPNFIALLDELGVESQPSDMSFSVSNRDSSSWLARSSPRSTSFSIASTRCFVSSSSRRFCSK